MKVEAVKKNDGSLGFWTVEDSDSDIVLNDIPCIFDADEQVCFTHIVMCDAKEFAESIANALQTAYELGRREGK